MTVPENLTLRGTAQNGNISCSAPFAGEARTGWGCQVRQRSLNVLEFLLVAWPLERTQLSSQT
jgi:hypothetical protein